MAWRSTRRFSANAPSSFDFHTGIDGTTGKVADMNAKDGPRIWEPYAVKVQTVKTAIEAASLILRVDDIVSGIKGQK